VEISAWIESCSWLSLRRSRHCRSSGPTCGVDAVADVMA
jgi:hypothetical protein